jgi:hypothetical protein
MLSDYDAVELFWVMWLRKMEAAIDVVLYRLTFDRLKP